MRVFLLLVVMVILRELFHRVLLHTRRESPRRDIRVVETTMLALIAVTVFSNWDPTRVHYVDRVGNAILVRGPSPINASNAFDLASMTSIIVAQAKAEGGYDLPTPFDLVDFTMLSNLKPSESKELTAEKNFFSAATTKFPTNASKLIPWTVIGDLANPNSYSTAIAKEMALNYESRIDEIPKKVR